VHPRERGELDQLALTSLRRYDERRYGSTLLVFYEHRAPADPAPPQQPAQENEP
jgi:hypothetical protein